MDAWTATNRSRVLWVAGALAGPLVLALTLRPAEPAIGVAPVSLALVVPVVIVAATGRWQLAVGAALSGTAAFDYLFTEPRGQFAITHVPDLVATVVLLGVGLIVVQVSVWGRRQQATAARTVQDVAALRSVVELMVLGEDADIVLMTAAFWLQDLLGLRDCRFDRSLNPPSPFRIEAGGSVTTGDIRWDAEANGLPGEAVDLPLLADGEPFARFVLQPTPVAPVHPDRLYTAAAVTDLVATWLHLRGASGRGSGDENPNWREQ
jgi:hypothetical protein